MSGSACKIILCGPPRVATLGMAEQLAREFLAGRVEVSAADLNDINLIADAANEKIGAICKKYIP